MGVLSNKIKREYLKPGDHIYSWRRAYVYAHHGIYVGEGNVIHFTRGPGQEIGKGTMLDSIIGSSLPSFRTDNPCSRCGDQSNLNGVITSCIDCFLSGGDLYLFEYGVTTAFFLAKFRGGTCTFASSDPPEDVIHRAKYLLQNGFGSYDSFKNNCEDFAIYCKTGLLVSTSKGGSGQATSFEAAAKAVFFPESPLLLYLTTGVSVSIAVGVGKYCVRRVYSDIGVRRDVQKVAVESLVASFHSGSSSNESSVVTEMFNGG